MHLELVVLHFEIEELMEIWERVAKEEKVLSAVYNNGV